MCIACPTYLFLLQLTTLVTVGEERDGVPRYSFFCILLFLASCLF